MEKETIRQTLERTAGHRKKAAQLLGISERDLYYKLRKYDLR
jgi:transcriptional regulator with PAS, ATPase and Fis domain